MVWQQKQKGEQKHHQAIPEGERSNKRTMRKPGIPPARIPEITWHFEANNGNAASQRECFEVTMCELLCLDGLRHVISGSWLGRSLVSAWCLCCFTHPLVWPCDFDVLPFVSAAIPRRDDTMLSPLALISP